MNGKKLFSGTPSLDDAAATAAAAAFCLGDGGQDQAALQGLQGRSHAVEILGDDLGEQLKRVRTQCLQLALDRLDLNPYLPQTPP